MNETKGMNFENRHLNQMKDAIVVVMGVFLTLKSVYKLLGYGTPISTFWYLVYLSVVIFIPIATAIYLLRKVLRK